MKIAISSPQEKYNYVLERISKACAVFGRSEKEVTLVGVTKGQEIDLIKAYINLGLKNIGESYVNEAIDKIPRIFEINPNVNVHFVGHLQRNKVKKIIPFIDLLHSVDTFKLAKEIDKRIPQINSRSGLKINDPFPIFVEVNLSREQSKFGCEPNKTLEIIEKIEDQLDHLSCKGIMTIAPFNAISNDALRQFYTEVKTHYELVLDHFPKCKQLSAGMSDDFEIAIEMGSTLIRLGTVLFGPRNS